MSSVFLSWMSRADDNGGPGFIPLTELDEVYAQFSSDSSTQQLRQRIHERLGPPNDIDDVFAVVWSHIESVFETCRVKTGGAAGNRRRGPPQTPRQITNLQALGRLNPERPTLGSQGSGSSDSSISSPVATPTSTNKLGAPEQPLAGEPRLQMQYAPPPVDDYSDLRGDVSGVAMMSFSVHGSSSAAGQGGGFITVPPPAHVHLGFSSQGQDVVEAMGSQLGHHPRLVSMDSGVGLNAGFPDQGTADFTGGPPFSSHTGFPTQGFAPTLSTSDLCLRLSPQATQGLQGAIFSPTGPSMVPEIPFYNPSSIEHKGFEGAGPHGKQWM